ncbi:MAG TPA: terminase, partial [Anaerolineae bacterium]|nr:terminase [Anaerolineae bacterium]
MSGAKAILRDRVLANDALWYPLPGPQLDADLCQADELFYGGAAGGGKTDLAIGLAITAHKRSLILRRDTTQLRGIIDRSREIIGDAGRLNENTGIWRLHDGRTIELNGCLLERHKAKFQGRPHDLLVFDEAPEFLESQVVFISGWVRTEDPDQQVRILLTGNPPTSAEGYWIIRRYAAWLDETHPNPAQPGELRWYAMVDGEETECPDGQPFEHVGNKGLETIQPRSRTFIPARVTDNPYYMATGYEAQLQALPEPLRSMMLYGDFSAGLDDDPWQVIPTAWVRLAQERWTEDGATGTLTALGCDPARGGKDFTAIARRYGGWFSYRKWPGVMTPDGPSVAALVLSELGDTTETGINVDVIGVGSAVYDALDAQGLGEHLHAVNFAA